MPFTGPLEDRILIRELYGESGDASSRGDKETWIATYADEGCEWNSPFFQCSGKAAIGAQWDALWADFEKVGFIGEVGSIEVEGDTAQCRATVREVIRLKDGKVFKLIGLYRDSLVRVNGAWKFTRRNYEALVLEDPQ